MDGVGSSNKMIQLIQTKEEQENSTSSFALRIFGPSYQNLLEIVKFAEGRKSTIKYFFTGVVTTSGMLGLVGGICGVIWGLKTSFGVISTALGLRAGGFSFLSALGGLFAIKSVEETALTADALVTGADLATEFLIELEKFLDSKDESRVPWILKKFEAMISFEDCLTIAKGEVSCCAISLGSWDPAITKKEAEMLDGIGKLWLIDEIIELLDADSKIASDWKKACDAITDEKNYDSADAFWKSFEVKAPLPLDYCSFQRQKKEMRQVMMAQQIKDIFKSIVAELED